MKKLKTLTLKLPSGEKISLKEDKVANSEFGWLSHFWYSYKGNGISISLNANDDDGNCCLLYTSRCV